MGQDARGSHKDNETLPELSLASSNMTGLPLTYRVHVTSLLTLPCQALATWQVRRAVRTL